MKKPKWTSKLETERGQLIQREYEKGKLSSKDSKRLEKLQTLHAGYLRRSRHGALDTRRVRKALKMLRALPLD